MRRTVKCEMNVKLMIVCHTVSVFPLGISCFMDSFVPMLCAIDEIVLLHAVDTLYAQAVQSELV
jgi:hypothetical protein